MPFHVGLKENVQKGITNFQRSGLSEVGALTDSGGPEEAVEIIPEMVPARCILLLTPFSVTLGLARVWWGTGQEKSILQ